MKALFVTIGLCVLTSPAFAFFPTEDKQANCTKEESEKSAILALTQAIGGNIFEATVSQDAEHAGVKNVSFQSYHLDDDSGELGLVPCKIAVFVDPKSCAPTVQLDDNLVCFQ